jgi:hypothetical protein
MMEALQYPIDRFEWAGQSTPDDRLKWIRIMAATPSELRKAVAGVQPA